MNTTKIVYVGAGSVSFGLSMFQDLFSCQELAGSTLTLVDHNQEALDRMTNLAEMMNAQSGSGLVIQATGNWKDALPGAQFVVNSAAIDRNRLWKLDFEIPRKYGIRHTLGENGGPGGLFFTLRTIPMILDLARDMEELCPKATFINFSNPESRIILAMGKYSKIRSIGLCHGIFMSQHAVAQIMNMPPEHVEVWGAGLNHFQWLLGIRDKDSHQDLYPLLFEKEKTYNPSFLPLSRQLLNAFGKFPTCSDDHLGEYLAYGWEAGEEGYNFSGDEEFRTSLSSLIDDILAGHETIPEHWFQPSGERGVAVITAMLHNKHTFVEAGIIYNQGVIPNLPAELAVEVPVILDAQGINPVSLGPLPDAIAKLLLMQASVQQLAVEAAVHGSKELAMQALLIDPVVNSTRSAAAILEELWLVNEPYIRKCI